MTRQERSAGFVIFHQPPQTRSSAEIEFLLLDYGRHWDFPKGHTEAGEDDLSTARRELLEETGIDDPVVVSGFKQEVSYFFRSPRHGLIQKTVAFFLARIKHRHVVLSKEHVGYAFLPYDQALKRLTFPSTKQILQAAWERVQRMNAEG